MSESYKPYICTSRYEWEEVQGIQVITWSDSDFAKMIDLFNSLDTKNILWDLWIRSAHRTWEVMMKSAQALPNVYVPKDVQGVIDTTSYKISVCIAAAWWAAHIAGMTASETANPVIAYPVWSSATWQTSSFLSMLEMPPWITNGVSTNLEEISKISVMINSLNLPKNYNKISVVNGIDQLDMIKLKESLEKYWLEIDNSWESPIQISMIDLDSSIENTNKIDDNVISLVLGISEKPVDILDNNLSDDEVKSNALKLRTLKNTTGLKTGIALKKSIRFWNTVLFAAEIIATFNPEIRKKLENSSQELRNEVLAKDKKLFTEQYGI